MAFSSNLPLTRRDQVRLKVGDIDPDQPILDDETYNHFLDVNNNSIGRAAIDAARTLLFYLTRYTRERTGQIEVYGGEWATNYRKALEMFLKDPNLNAITPVPYAGGISKADMQANNDNSDNVGLWRGGCKEDEEDTSNLRF